MREFKLDAIRVNRRSTSLDGSLKVRRNSSQLPSSSRKSSMRSVPPPSPTLTYVTAFDDITTYSGPSPASERKSPELKEKRLSSNRVSFDETSDPGAAAPQRRRSQSQSPHRSEEGPSPTDGNHSEEDEDVGRNGDNMVFLSDDFVAEDQLSGLCGQPLSSRSGC